MDSDILAKQQSVWRWAGRAAVVIVFLVVAIGMHHALLPVGRWSETTFTRDAIFQTYLLAWGSHALLTNPLSFYKPPIFWPDAGVVFSVDALELPALIMAPLWAIMQNPYLLANVMIVISHLFALAAAYFVGRRQFVLNRPLAVLVAFLFAVSSDRLSHAWGHYQLVWTGLIPLIWYAVWQILERPRRSTVIAVALSLGLSVYFSVYLLVLAALCAVTTVGCWLLSHRKLPTRQSLKLLAMSTIAGAVIAGPKLLLHALAARGISSNRASLAEAALYSASWSGYLLPPSDRSLSTRLFGIRPHVPANSEDLQFLGYLLLLILAGEVVRVARAYLRRTATQAEALSAVSFAAAAGLILCSLGPDFRVVGISPYCFLHAVGLQFTEFYRAPARLAFVAQWFLLIPVCTFLQAIRLNFQVKLSLILGTFGGVIIFAEHLIPRPMSIQAHRSAAVREMMNTVDPSHTQPYLDLTPEMYLGQALGDVTTWRPTVNGWECAVLSPGFDRRVLAFNTDFPSTGTLGWLATNGVPWVITHGAPLPPALRQHTQLSHVAASGDTHLYWIRSIDVVRRDYADYLTSRAIELEAMRQSTPSVFSLDESQVPKSLASDSPGGIDIVNLENHAEPGARFALLLETNQRQSAETTGTTRPTSAGAISLGLYDKIHVTYHLNGSSARHRAQIFWGNGNEITGTRKVKARVQAPGSDKSTWTATFDMSHNHNWYTDENAEWVAIQFDRFKGDPPQSLTVVRITQERTESRVEIPPIDAVP